MNTRRHKGETEQEHTTISLTFKSGYCGPPAADLSDIHAVFLYSSGFRREEAPTNALYASPWTSSMELQPAMPLRVPWRLCISDLYVSCKGVHGRKKISEDVEAPSK
eukprot:gene6258-4507_t